MSYVVEQPNNPAFCIPHSEFRIPHCVSMWSGSVIFRFSPIPIPAKRSHLGGMNRIKNISHALRSRLRRDSGKGRAVLRLAQDMAENAEIYPPWRV